MIVRFPNPGVFPVLIYGGCFGIRFLSIGHFTKGVTHLETYRIALSAGDKGIILYEKDSENSRSLFWSLLSFQCKRAEMAVPFITAFSVEWIT